MLYDKIIQIAVFESKIYALSESGKLYERYSNSDEWQLTAESPKKTGVEKVITDINNKVESKPRVTFWQWLRLTK